MCSMSLTVVVRKPSKLRTMRPSISPGDMPGYCQITEMTGMSTSGKMSVGMRKIATSPSRVMAMAMTTKV
jgi:hypothetical protein